MSSKHFPQKQLLHSYVNILVKYIFRGQTITTIILTSNEALHKFVGSLIKTKFRPRNGEKFFYILEF